MKIIKGGITAPLGFKANGLSCGIKRSGKPDLALIVSEIPAVCAGVFTKNSVKAAPVIVSQSKLKDNKAQAIIVNSGNANCFTREFGLIYAKRMTTHTAKLLNIDAKNVLVSSTGIIGKPLPIKKIQASTPNLVKGLNKKGSAQAARAILTTDKNTKEITGTFMLGKKKITIGGIAKGSGMIAPNMATMLAFITTDTAIEAKALKKALIEATNDTFNCITVDGCMSTNDMVTVMANGLAKNKTIKSAGKDYQVFLEALKAVCLDLAKKIVYDAEGGTKFIEINVTGAQSPQQAKKIGLAIANSNLVKTAAFGSNPNWGRVAAAVGSLGLKIDEKQLKISFSPFSKKEINIYVQLNLGQYKAAIYTSDLSMEYVRINGKYN